MRRNYHRKLWGEIITGNYEEKLSKEIRGKRAENCLHNVGKSLGEGLAVQLKFRSLAVSEFRVLEFFGEL